MFDMRSKNSIFRLQKSNAENGIGQAVIIRQITTVTEPPNVNVGIYGEPSTFQFRKEADQTVALHMSEMFDKFGW